MFFSSTEPKVGVAVTAPHTATSSTPSDTLKRLPKNLPTPQTTVNQDTSSAMPRDRLDDATGEAAKVSPFAKSWVHFVAGGLGGMTSATLTAPLDVVRTRLQSDMYQVPMRAAPSTILTPAGVGATSSATIAHSPAALAAQAAARSAATRYSRNPVAAAGQHIGDTLGMLGQVRRAEGTRALFKGLPANLAGVVPARSIHFYAYGNGKQVIARLFNGGDDSAALVHLGAGVLAGVATATATNPIWLVKTRMQLDRDGAGGKMIAGDGATGVRRYRNSLDCVRQVLREEGIRGLYKGMSASYLGVAESTIQWVLYEQLKAALRRREARLAQVYHDGPATKSSSSSSKLSPPIERPWSIRVSDALGPVFAAGGAKLVASVLTYPHEVVRTRLRQAPDDNGIRKYRGLVQAFRVIWLEEGLRGLYGGMTPHLMRTVPSAAIMFTIYEGTLRLFGAD